ncbi:MAG: efflux RND transporter periplasmic adaptor subunit [Anaerolineales bacterium]|nr:efflux RND transporter periplasmic adaptor subunit [Anaerolineales bacterium]
MRKFFSKKSRRVWAIGAALAVVFAAYYFLRPQTTATAFETVAVERGNLAAYVGATGSVRTRQTAALTWQTGGSVGAINVRVGDKVKRDQILASLDKASLSQSVILAEADLVNSQKALDDLLESNTALLQAEKAVKDAEKAYAKAYNWRMQLNGKVDIKDWYYDQYGNLKLKEYKGYASKETIAQADRDLALAESKLEDARRDYDRLLKGEDSDDVIAARARVAAAEATLKTANVYAPFDGTITQANLSVGDQVSPGTSAFRIDDLSSLLVDVQISEVDINSVALGQAATLSFDAILDRTYHGKVVEVGQTGETVQGVVNFNVTVELTDADEKVKPGMTAAVNIVTEEVKNVLLIPSRAVRSSQGERVVYVEKNGMPVAVPVTLGLSSDTMSILTSGDIKEGDLIILNPPTVTTIRFGG